MIETLVWYLTTICWHAYGQCFLIILKVNELLRMTLDLSPACFKVSIHQTGSPTMIQIKFHDTILIYQFNQGSVIL